MREPGLIDYPDLGEQIPFFSFGNEAVGVIAIGNVARGVIAIGGSASVGVIAIGTNAVGAIAIGLNAAGPLAIGIINGAGVAVFAGVNALGGFGRGFVNNGIHLALGMALMAVGVIVGQLIHRERTPASSDADPDELLGVSRLATGDPGVYNMTARVERTADGLVLSSGPLRIPVEGDGDIPLAFDRRCQCTVEITDEFDDAPADYRVAAEKRRRIVLKATTPIAKPPLFATSDDLAWALGRGLQVASLASGLIVLSIDLIRR